MKTNELEIIGYSSEKKEIEKLKATLLRTDDYSDMGIRVPGGLIIYGPSGSGKTLLATSIESDEIKMYEITEADMLSEDEFLAMLGTENLPQSTVQAASTAQSTNQLSLF